MKLDDKEVLEHLHLDRADLSANRSFVQEAREGYMQGDLHDLTGSDRKVRWILLHTDQRSARESMAGGASSTWMDTELDQHAPEPRAHKPVVWIPVVPPSNEFFDALQKFEGTVLSLTEDSFIARLVDKTNPGPEEEAEIPLEEITPGDRELATVGAVFYWIIGYRRDSHGQRSRASVIRFQRLPSWSQADVERAKEEANKLLSFLDLERANSAA